HTPVALLFVCNTPSTTYTYTLSLHDALPILTSDSEWNGRYVLKSEWSPDSRFFVFSTFSSGGHSGWNFRTFVYSVDANKFVSVRSEEHTSELQSRFDLVCRLLLEKKK